GRSVEHAVGRRHSWGSGPSGVGAGRVRRQIHRSMTTRRYPIVDRLPEGTVAVGGGLLVNGLAAYAFITLASRDLGPEAYTPVGLLWALSFLLGPGFFQPLEQEVARIVAARSDRRIGPVA
ncbi:MAG TPA: hypothetical protein DCR10_04255, partial [Acidimicrobiaceae bacterium]|nr:hypothetical protein [Acidimicrobiaceae bacterium]